MSDNAYLQGLLDVSKTNGSPVNLPVGDWYIDAPLTCINSPYTLVMRGVDWNLTRIHALQAMSKILDVSGTRVVLKDFMLDGSSYIHTDGLVFAPGPVSFDRCYLRRLYISGSFTDATWKNTAVGSSTAEQLMLYNYNNDIGQVILMIGAYNWDYLSVEQHRFTSNRDMPTMTFRGSAGHNYFGGNISGDWHTPGGQSAYVAWDGTCFGGFVFDTEFYTDSGLPPAAHFNAAGAVNLSIARSFPPGATPTYAGGPFHLF